MLSREKIIKREAILGRGSIMMGSTDRKGQKGFGSKIETLNLKEMLTPFH